MFTDQDMKGLQPWFTPRGERRYPTGLGYTYMEWAAAIVLGICSPLLWPAFPFTTVRHDGDVGPLLSDDPTLKANDAVVGTATRRNRWLTENLSEPFCILRCFIDPENGDV